MAIIGAGPAGLLLSHLLACRGIESVILENRSRPYARRGSAGILEQGTVDLLTDLGLEARRHADGLKHDGIYLQWPAPVIIWTFPTCVVDRCGSTGRPKWSKI